MSQVKQSILQTIIFSSLGAIILYLLWQSLASSYAEDCAINGIPVQDCSLWGKLISDFKSTNYYWICAMCLAYMISCLFRAMRWIMLFKSMGYQTRLVNSFYTVMIGYFANLGLPRMGEFIRAGLFSRYEGIPYEKVLGTIVVGRIIDFLCLITLIIMGLLIHRELMLDYFQENLNFNSGTKLKIAAGGLTGLIGLIYLYKHYNNSDQAPSWFLKVRNIIDGFIEGIISLKSVENLLLFMFYSVGIWFIYVAMHWIGFLSFAPTQDISLSDSLLCFDFAALGMVFPSPGGMGSYHAMLVESLTLLGIDQISAFSIAMITFFAINIFCNILFGLISLILLPFANRS